MKKEEAYPQGVLDSQQLLGHNTQHLFINAVEFIKAGPCTRLSQAGKEPAHEPIVQTVTTVEHKALHAQGLGQVLHDLRFSSACRP